MAQQLLGTITDMIHINPHAWSMTLDVGHSLRPELKGPGQFVHVRCSRSRLLRRPISICSYQTCAAGDLLRLVFEVRGEGTAWLSRRRLGATLDLMGPLGNGFRLSPEGRYLLVGGGIGVPPLLGCLLSAAGRCDAVLGFRDASHALLVDEFHARCPGLVVTTEDGSLGLPGFVTGPVESLFAKNHYEGVLCCGPKAMLKAVAALAARYGVPCQVSLEERMACGVGACLGCALPMADGSVKHVCKDGPIFNALEVDWND